MTLDPTRLGADLRLLGDLEHQVQRERGSDLRTIRRTASSRDDLELVEGVANLQQALLLAFLTDRGELAHLGHPGHGSRLYALIGEPNTQRNRDRARLFALQVLLAEPRVAEVTSLTVTTRRDAPSVVDIRATLAVLDEPSQLNLVVPFDFAGGGS